MTEAVILAAGKGKRLGMVTRAIPKPLLCIRGKPILEHNVEWCRKHGIKKLFINLHHLPRMVTGHFGNGSKWGVSIVYHLEKKLMGTSGAVKAFQKKIGKRPFFIIYGDNYVPYDLKAMMRRHIAAKADMSLAVFKLKTLKNSGAVLLNSSNRILEFKEKPTGKPPKNAWVNAGVYVMNPALARAIPSGFSDFGRDVIPRFLRLGYKLHAVKMRKKVGAVDTPELYRQWRDKKI
ncbi:MAG: nucleotidyltransferase family protein [Elusimicrobiota bacterium]